MQRSRRIKFPTCTKRTRGRRNRIQHLAQKRRLCVAITERERERGFASEERRGEFIEVEDEADDATCHSTNGNCDVAKGREVVIKFVRRWEMAPGFGDNYEWTTGGVACVNSISTCAWETSLLSSLGEFLNNNIVLILVFNFT